jgi:uncharacterized protein (UPF0332 family)
MKVSNWEECLELNDASKITSDKEKAKSLREIADERIKQSKKINEKNANFVFEDYYSSVIEMIHYLVLLKGYKISNHVCLGYYLKEVLKREDLFRIFDDLRYKRNSLTYYGKKMDFGIAKDAIGKSKNLLKELKKIKV